MLKTVFVRFAIVRELLSFFWKEKLWWMIPFVAILLVIGLLLLFAQASPVIPFLYTAF